VEPKILNEIECKAIKSDSVDCKKEKNELGKD